MEVAPTKKLAEMWHWRSRRSFRIYVAGFVGFGILDICKIL